MRERWFAALPQQGEPASPRWESQQFRDELTAWCEQALGPIDTLELFKLRGWASVWRVTTSDGVWFAKQNCPGQAHEAAALQVMTKVSPDRVIAVTALDPERDLMLTPDQSPVFGETVGDDPGAWGRLVREGALLQRELVDHMDALKRAGLTEMAPSMIADYTEARIEQLAVLPKDDARHLPQDDAETLRSRLPWLREQAEIVAALGLPITLNHNDLHEHNVFDIEGQLRFFDFGDAVLTDPLGVLRVPLNVLGNKFGCPQDDPRLTRVSEAALEVWSDLAPLPHLRAALPAALTLGRLARVESWIRVLPSLTDEQLQETGPTPGAWLASLLED